MREITRDELGKVAWVCRGWAALSDTGSFGTGSVLILLSASERTLGYKSDLGRQEESWVERENSQCTLAIIT